MYLILGGTGHIGSRTAEALIERGERVTLVTRNSAHAERWRRRGANVATCDVLDSDALRKVLQRGRRLFLLNPPADVAKNTDVQERQTLTSILNAVAGSELEKVVALSTYGAQPGLHLGDLGVLYEMEQALAKQSTPFQVIRSAYLMSNWDAQIDSVRTDGVLRSMLPADLKLPMVAPADVGQAAADQLVSATTATAIHYVEGPRVYTATDVAEAFAGALQRTVKLEVIPPDQWEASYRQLGFSAETAASYAAMTRVTMEATEWPESPWRGETTLAAYLSNVVPTLPGT